MGDESISQIEHKFIALCQIFFRFPTEKVKVTWDLMSKLRIEFVTALMT